MDPVDIERRAQELAVAERIKTLEDVELPPLPDWNYAPCRLHTEITDGCRRCGIIFRQHQRIGLTWLYFSRLSLLADSVGTGKTAQLLGVTALRRARGEAGPRARTLVVCRPQAIDQWSVETARMLPLVPVMTATGTVRERMNKYVQPWEICIIGYQMLNNDIDRLMNFPILHVQADDVDALRSRQNRTHHSINRLMLRAREAGGSCAIASGTPLQKRLHELYAVLEGLDGASVFGRESDFMHRYIRREPVTRYIGRGRRVVAQKVVGYKNVGEFVDKLRPFALRRTAADIHDVTLPEIIPSNVFLDLYPAQKEAYAELQEGVKRIQAEHGAQVSQATAMAKIHHGARICAGMAAIGMPDGPETSVKFDWLMDKLDDGDLSDDKVMLFIAYKDTIRNIAHPRLDAAGIGHVTLWGDEPDRQVRANRVARFWDDPSCRVLIGTQAIEQSLNLQCARHIVNIDMILNPSRMEQLTGRIRRQGSAFESVYVHNLLTNHTQEARYLPLLQREQALIDRVWNEQSELFEALSPLALLNLITD